MKLKRNLKYGASALVMALALTACGTDADKAADKVEQKTESVEQNIETKTEDAKDSVEKKVDELKTGLEEKEFALSLDDAVAKFKEIFPAEGVEVTSVELDEEDGRYVYDVQGYDQEKEYEATIDAESGEIISSEEEVDDVDPDDVAIDFEKILSPKEAMTKAMENNNGYVKSYELEWEDDKMTYDIDVQDGDEVKLDAETGDILSK